MSYTDMDNDVLLMSIWRQLLGNCSNSAVTSFLNHNILYILVS